MLRTNSMKSCRTIQTRLIISSVYVFYCELSLSVSRWKRKSPLSGTSIGIWLVTVSRKLSLRYSVVAFTSSCGNEAFMNSALLPKVHSSVLRYSMPDGEAPATSADCLYWSESAYINRGCHKPYIQYWQSV